MPTSLLCRLEDHVSALVSHRLGRANLDGFDTETREVVEQLARDIPRALLQPALERLTRANPDRARRLEESFERLFLPRDRDGENPHEAT